MSIFNLLKRTLKILLLEDFSCNRFRICIENRFRDKGKKPFSNISILKC